MPVIANYLILIMVFVLTSIGCRSIPIAADGRKAENIPLRAMAHNTRSPELGKIYVHNGGRSLKVIQVLKGGVLVHPMVGNIEFNFRGFVAFDEK